MFSIDMDTDSGGKLPQSSQASANDSGTKFTIPGILHFIQHEWARFEMERAHWEVERAELQVRKKSSILTHLPSLETAISTLEPKLVYSALSIPRNGSYSLFLTRKNKNYKFKLVLCQNDLSDLRMSFLLIS